MFNIGRFEVKELHERIEGKKRGILENSFSVNWVCYMPSELERERGEIRASI